MAHPYRSAGRAGAKSKFKAMLGTSAGAKHFDADTVANASTPVKDGIEDVKIMGKKPPARLDRARGGKVAKTTVNVIVPPAQPSAPPMLKPPLPMPPPGPGPAAGPPGGPPMRPPMMPPGLLPGGGGAGVPAPMMRADGGKVGLYIGGEATSPKLKQWAQYARKNSYQKKYGGGIGDYPITGGADTGVARLQRSKKLAKKRSKSEG